LDDKANVREQLFELLHAVEKGQYLELTPNFFPKTIEVFI